METSSLELRLKAKLHLAMKIKDVESRNTLRVIIGEISRLNKKVGEEATEEEVIKILRKLQKNEKLVIGDGEPTIFLKIVEHYLPKMLSREEIFEHINNNVDFTIFKNKMQAMGSIMKELKGKADGNLVKDVLLSI